MGKKPLFPARTASFERRRVKEGAFSQIDAAKKSPPAATCIFIILLFLMLSANMTSASSSVTGIIGEDTVWTLADSPYIVTGDVIVRQISADLLPTLTVEPGVTVRFEPGTGLFVGDVDGDGVLDARGDEGEPVIFTSNAASPAPGDWKGIVINESAGDKLDIGGSCASSVYYSQYPCESSTDGNPATFFHSLSGPTHWVGYDFGVDNAQQFNKIRMYLHDGYGVENLVVEGSNGIEGDWDTKSWDTLATVDDGHGGWNVIRFINDTPYRFVRIVATGGYEKTDCLVVDELEIFMVPQGGSTLEHCVVEYAGTGNSYNIYLNTIGAVINKSTIRYSGGSGISFVGLANLAYSGVISENTLTGNATYGIYSEDAWSAPGIVQNIITDNGAYPVRVGPMVGLSDNTFLGNQIQAIELLPGEIDRDTTWRNAGIGYVVTGDVTVRQAAGKAMPTLTVEPGVEVRFESGTGLVIGDGNGEATLSALGAQNEPVIFTSNAASPAPGDWKGIVINESAGDKLDIGGSCASSVYYSQYPCESSTDGNPATFFHSLSGPTHWVGYDFGVDNAQQFSKIRVYLHDGYGVQNLVVEGANGIEEDWDTKSWDTLATVDDGHGGWNVIRFISDTPYRFVRIVATGGYEKPDFFVVDELEIFTTPQLRSTLEHCTLEYGGHTYGSNLYVDNANPLVRFSASRKSSSSGIYLTGPQCTNAIVNCNDIEDNAYGIYLSGEAYPNIADNNIFNNLTHGLHTDNTKALTAENNWWGDPNGPNLSGDTIQGNVDFEPWLTGKNDCLFDKTPPQLMETVPAGGASLFNVEQITVTLFEIQNDVDDGAVSGSFSVRNESNEAVPGSVSEANDLFTFIPETAPFADGVYHVAFTSVDTLGNSQAHEFSFTVESNLDTDEDGLPDWWEQEHFGSLTASGADDPDNDRLSNLQEYSISADPNGFDPDNDDDAVPDWWELEKFGNLSEERAGDPDNDGFSNLTEYKTGTIPTDADSKPVPGRYLEYDTHGRIKDIVVIKPSN